MTFPSSKDGQYLKTDRGLLSLSGLGTTFVDGVWITRGGEDLLCHQIMNPYVQVPLVIFLSLDMLMAK